MLGERSVDLEGVSIEISVHGSSICQIVSAGDKQAHVTQTVTPNSGTTAAIPDSLLLTIHRFAFYFVIMLLMLITKL